jgi:GntR family transcriptional regulator
MIKLSIGEKDNMQYLHEKIYKKLKGKILSGEFKPGDKLPKEMDLINIYEVSRHTLRKAMDRLFNEGYI